MNRFDNALRDALQRQRPPSDLAERVLARAHAAQARGFRRRAWSWAVAAAAGAMLVAAPLLYDQHVREMQGRQAKEQVMRSLNLTAAKLREVQNRVADIEDRVIDVSNR